MIFKSKSAYDWMVVGLGNPGMQYENTRHNAGFKAMDELKNEYGFEFLKNKFEAKIGETAIAGNRVLVLKPQTFMNNSGRAVSAAASFYKIPTDKIIIVFDDTTLDVGKLRIRRKGTHGGHNGIKDIIELLGTDDILRIKIGVGLKPNPEYPLADWVLGKFRKDDEKPLSEALKNSVGAIEEIIARSVDSAMNKYNS